MGEVIQFPAPVSAWDQAAGETLQRHCAPFYAKPGLIPPRFWHSWFKLVYAMKDFSSYKSPADISWDALWEVFRDSWLEKQPEWHAAVAAASK